MTLNSRVRDFARSNPVAYKAWFIYYRYRKASSPILPASGDSLYLDGYPRSGNTYFTAAIQQIYSGLRFSNHLHVTAPIKIAINKKVPTFLLMREPENAIASFFLHVRDPRSTSSKNKLNAKRLCECLATEWFNYYSFVEKQKRRIHVVSADDAFNEPLQAVKRIVELSRLPPFPDLDKRFDEFHDRFKKHDAGKAQGSTSFPDPSREKQKREVLRLLRSFRLLARCRELHAALVSESILNA